MPPHGRRLDPPSAATSSRLAATSRSVAAPSGSDAVDSALGRRDQHAGSTAPGASGPPRRGRGLRSREDLRPRALPMSRRTRRAARPRGRCPAERPRASPTIGTPIRSRSLLATTSPASSQLGQGDVEASIRGASGIPRPDALDGREREPPSDRPRRRRGAVEQRASGHSADRRPATRTAVPPTPRSPASSTAARRRTRLPDVGGQLQRPRRLLTLAPPVARQARDNGERVLRTEWRDVDHAARVGPHRVAHHRSEEAPSGARPDRSRTREVATVADPRRSASAGGIR